MKQVKKLVGFLVLALGFATVTMAQEHRKEKRHEKMSVEQQTELAVKKMTLKLDLTPSQQHKIKPLLAKQIQERKAMHEKRRDMKDQDKKPSSDEHFNRMNARLDKQIAFKAEMKQILDARQYERFEKMAAKKMKHMKKRMHKKGEKHKRTEHEDDDN